MKWQDHVNTEELLNRAEMRPLSKEIMKRRWRMIGHILRKDKNSDEMPQKGENAKVDQKQLGGEQLKRKENLRQIS